MKIKYFLITIIVIAALVGGWIYLKQKPHTGDHRSEPTLYTCPMHPQIVQDAPGNCPICGMTLVPIQNEPDKKDEHADHAKKEPEGNKALTAEEFFKEDAETDTQRFSIPQAKREMLGLSFVAVSKRKIAKEVRTTVRIVPDERRLYRIATKIEGWIKTLYVNQTGQFVEKGDPLFSIYSPQLLSTQYEYLSAKASVDELSRTNDPILGNVREIKQSAYERLRLYDMTDGQIRELEKKGEPANETVFYSPASGFITEKSILEGQKIMPNDSLVVIADMSRVWGEADIYETDLPYVKEGMPVDLSLSYFQDTVFKGKISFLYPYLDPSTRTLKARIDIPNPDYALKLEMYAEAKINYSIGEALAIPEQAVMRTGKEDYVFTEGPGDEIARKKIRLGIRSADGYYEVKSGLFEGEHIVASAKFLIDSESSLKAAVEAAREAHQH